MPEVHYETRGRVAVLAIDNPPVNAMSPAVWAALHELMARAAGDADVDAIVVTGRGRTFVAGSDIAAFDLLTTRQQSLDRSEWRHATLRGFEDIAKPVVAAIHGHALGGGLELAMACHYRVAARATVFGQPEVLLGLITGAGGSQRLPRLCGAERALSMCTSGQSIDAGEALRAGIVDAVVEGDVINAACDFAAVRAAGGNRRPTSGIAIEAETAAAGRAACAAARAALGRPERVGQAPYVAIDAIEGCFALPFDEGARRERELFADRVLSTESRALRHLFFAERDAAKLPDVPKGSAEGIASAAVIGAGTMGVGIALAYAAAGIPVALIDVNPDVLDSGVATIRAHVASAVAKGRISAVEGERTVAAVSPGASLEAVRDVDIVVEAVFEDMVLKETLFAELGRLTRQHCILASNTSALDIDALGRASGRPHFVIGHHFFSPAHVMKLLEVVRGRETAPAVVATSLALARRLRKVPVVVGNAFGFVANRMLGYYMREAYLLLEEGAGVEQIDRVLTDFGYAVGPFQMQDIAGIDVGARIRQHLKVLGRTRADGPQSEVPDRLFELGHYGQKTGRGWYRYAAGNRAGTADPDVDVIAAAEAQKRGVQRRVIDDEEILARMMTALAGEGVRALDEGVALKAGDIDVIYTCGFGFPRHRGGPMFYADTVGLEVVADRIRDYRQRFGDYWTLSPLLARLAAEGGRLTAPAVAAV